MTTPHTLTPPRLLRLRPGESRPLRLPVGTQLLLREGRLRLDGPPAWIAERLQRPQRMLHAGDSHRLDTPGWTQLSADTGAVELMLALPAPAGAWQRMWQRVRELLRLGARRLHHLRPLA